MPNTKAPASERFAVAFRQLAESSQNLENAVSEWKKHVSTLNVALKRLKIGVSAWLQIASGGDEANEWWTRELGYASVKGDWCIALRKQWGHYQFPNDDKEEVWRFEDAPRWLMVESAGKIPDLLETLVKRTDETTQKVTKQAKETEELAKILGSLEAEAGWLRAAMEVSK